MGVRALINISKEILEQMLLDGTNRYPEECCGILFGRIDEKGVKTAEYAEYADNSRDESEKKRRFEITPEIMLKAELTARRRGYDIIGFYHSHPDCEAIPSEYDRSHALPVYSYIIMSVVKGKALQTKSYELSPDSRQFREEKINII